MKLTLRKLRTFIRESLEEQDLDERAMTSKDAGDDLALMVDEQHDSIDLVLYHVDAMTKGIANDDDPDTLQDYVVAALQARQSDFDVPFFEVRYVAAEKGWGPFMYDVAMSLTPGLMPDRLSVSSDAKRIWDHYYNQRNDVKVTPLDRFNVKLKGDDVLDNGFSLKGPGPDVSALRERHDPKLNDDVSYLGRRYFTSRAKPIN